MKKNNYKIIDSNEFSSVVDSKEKLNEVVSLIRNGYRILVNDTRIFASENYLINFVKKYLSKPFRVIVIKPSQKSNKSIWD